MSNKDVYKIETPFGIMEVLPQGEHNFQIQTTGYTSSDHDSRGAPVTPKTRRP